MDLVESQADDDSTDLIGENSAAYRPRAKTPLVRFNNYK